MYEVGIIEQLAVPVCEKHAHARYLLPKYGSASVHAILTTQSRPPTTDIRACYIRL